jgi:hypothetical protein
MEGVVEGDDVTIGMAVGVPNTYLVGDDDGDDVVGDVVGDDDVVGDVVGDDDGDDVVGDVVGDDVVGDDDGDTPISLTTLLLVINTPLMYMGEHS